MEFFESNGVKLAGVLEGPEKTPIVVMGHGLSSSKDNSTNKAICPILHKDGIATFRFDFFAHGDSEGDFSELTPSKGVQNAIDAIEFVKSKGYTNISYFGGSFGGYVGYMVGSKAPFLTALVVKCPVADFTEINKRLVEEDMETWEKQGYSHYFSYSQQKKIRINYTFASDGNTNPAYPYLKKIEMSTLIVHGDKDTVVPIDQSKKAAEMIPHCMLAVVDGAGHEFDPGFDKMVQLSTAFIIEHAK